MVAGTPFLADSFSLHLCSNHDVGCSEIMVKSVFQDTSPLSLSLSLWLSFVSENIFFCLEFRMMFEFWCCTFIMES